MRSTKVLGTCVAAVAVACAFSGPAMAETLKFGPGQPIGSGNLGEGGVLHCQPTTEFFWADLPPGGGPGVIIFNKHGARITGPPGNDVCEQVAAGLGL